MPLEPSPDEPRHDSDPRGGHLPDPDAVARAEKLPERGPRILFLSGGTALRGLSRALTRYTHNSVHVITPFDSGGSSAVLRKAFGMLAVGDIRSRLLALASDQRARPLRRLLGKRLPADGPASQARLRALASGEDPWVEDLEAPDRGRIADSLTEFLRHMPERFDLRGASLGNLVLAAGYLETRSIGEAIETLSGMLRARGRVLPTTDADLHLAARLADGSETIGQHRLTGKEHAPLQSRITELRVVELGDGGAVRVTPTASPAVLDEIGRADLVCYPMGSFYTSVLCNALPRGVGTAIARAACPKLYVPSTGRDPELVDTDLGGAAKLLVETLREDVPDAPAPALLDGVLLDANPDVYPAPPAPGAIEALGARRIETELVTPHSLPRIDSERLAQVLVSLAAPGALERR